MNSSSWKRKRALQDKMRNVRSGKRRKVSDVADVESEAIIEIPDLSEVRLNVQDFSDAEDTDAEFEPSEYHEDYM